MAEQSGTQEQQQELSLPIHIPTLIKALLQKKWWVVFLIVLACGLGVGVALQFGSQSYEAVTVMYYQPVASALSDQFIVYQSLDSDTALSYQQGAQLTKREDETISLNTLVNMVEIVPNFVQLRDELNLEMSLDQIGSAIFVDTARETNLMLIYGTAETRELAADIANTIRDIFLENTKKITMSELEEQKKSLELQLSKIQIELEESKQDFDRFLAENELENVDLVNTPYAKQYLDTSLALERDESLVKVYMMEIDKINETIADTTNLIEREKSDSSKGLTQDDLSVQILLLQEQIQELRSKEVNSIMIQQEEELYRIAQEQYANGLIGRAELTEAQYQFELAVAQYADTTEIDYLKDQIEDIRDTEVVGYGESISYSEYLKELRLKRVDAELNLLAARESYETNLKIMADLEKTLADYPTKVQEYLSLSGAITSLRAEGRGIEKMLSQTKIAIEQQYSDFMIVSDAVPPTYSAGSNKKILAAGTAILVFLLGFVIIFLRVFLDKRLRSEGEATLRIKQSVAAVIPDTRKEAQLYPSVDTQSIHIERYRMLARPLRQRFPSHGASFLVTSTVEKEGKTMVSINLAAVFGRQDERVLIIEGQVRKKSSETDYSRILFTGEDQGEPAGLGEYLSYTADSLEEILHHTILAGVDVLPIRTEAVNPDMLQSVRMKELISELKQMYSVILIEAPAVSDSVDAEILAQYCDSVLFVVSSSKAPPADIRAAIGRMKKVPIQVFGVILTGIHRYFL